MFSVNAQNSKYRTEMRFKLYALALCSALINAHLHPVAPLERQLKAIVDSRPIIGILQYALS